MSAASWCESDPLWKTWETHIESCSHGKCGCQIFERHYKGWASQLPTVQSSNDMSSKNSWLWFKFTETGMFRWTCLICHSDPTEEYDGLGPDDVQSVRISNLIRHHNSVWHKSNVRKFLGEESCVVNHTSPSIELFHEVLTEFKKGIAPWKGYDLPSGVQIGQLKASAILWCIDQVWADVRRERLQHAACINIMRDGSSARLHHRYSLTTNEFETFKGYLGQSRYYKPDAIGITDATVEVVRAACTSRNNVPAGCNSLLVKKVKPVFNEALFDRTCDAVEAISIDSAENEVVSARDMATPRDNGAPAPFNNCIHPLRDGAHSARRILTRLWKADAVLDYTYQFFMLIASMIHWSDDLKTDYVECTASSTNKAVATTFGHMRAAKHRVEASLSPLSRACLDPEGSVCMSL